VKSDYSQSVESGLNHNDGRGEDLLDDGLSNIRNGTGSYTGTLSVLSNTASSRALIAYFRDRNVQAFRQWAYVVARIDAELISSGWYGDYLVGDLIWPLLSDNEDVIKWFSMSAPRFASEIFQKEIDKPKSFAFYRYQAYLALQGRWDELGERAQRVLSIADQIKRDTEYLIDQEFYLALARSDTAAIQSVLERLTDPKSRKKRYRTQNGLARDLLDTYGILFAKMVHRAGHEVAISSPWVPEELLAYKPCIEYPDFWGIFTPLK